MKLVLYDDYRLGILKNERVVDAMTALEGMHFHRPQDLIETVITEWNELKPRIEEATEGKEGVPIDSVSFRPPVPKPPKIICAAVNYLEFGQREPDEMDAFIKASTAVIGSGDTVELPPINASVFHHEPELAFVVGRRASNVGEAEAMNYIFGYLNFLDMSARGITPNNHRSFWMGKSWDTFAPMGPAITTADEIPDPHNLQVRLWNNDEPRHDFPTSDMAYNIPKLIESYSSITTLEPGDVIATGVNHQQIGPVQDGDVIRMEIKELGPSLVVSIHDPLKREWPRGIDHAFAVGVLGRR